MPGYLQDMRQSGICQRDESVSDEELQSKCSKYPKYLKTSSALTIISIINQLINSFSEIVAEVQQSEATTRSYPIRRKRAQASEKPTRMERLQWPGPHGFP